MQKVPKSSAAAGDCSLDTSYSTKHRCPNDPTPIRAYHQKGPDCCSSRTSSRFALDFIIYLLTSDYLLTNCEERFGGATRLSVWER